MYTARRSPSPVSLTEVSSHTPSILRLRLELSRPAAMKKEARARRQRIPAFGEWNYAYVDDGAGDWPVTQFFDSAMHAGRLVMAIPPKPAANKVVKWRESATTPALELDDDEDEKRQRRQHVVVGLAGEGDHGGAVKKQPQQSPVVVSHGYKAACRVGVGPAAVVKAMDQDLYHIPPDMLCHEPRKRLTRRSLWTGCLGLNCVA